jgi:hypothetical protein
MTILRDIRSTMTPGERSRLNSPISARQRVDKVLSARASGNEEAARASPLRILKQQLAESQRAQAHLQEQLAAAQTDGSRFDLVRSSVDNIATVIADPGTISHGRAKNIALTVLDKLGYEKPALRKKPSPAG